MVSLSTVMAKEPPRPTLPPTAAALAATCLSMMLLAAMLPSSASIRLFSRVRPSRASLVTEEITSPRTGVMEMPPAEPALAFITSLFSDSAEIVRFCRGAVASRLRVVFSQTSATASTPMTATAMPAPTPAEEPSAPSGLVPSAAVLNWLLLLASRDSAPLPRFTSAASRICA